MQPDGLLAAIARILIAAPATLTAAQSFVVDANNGPGTNFTSIAAAVTAVPDGAVLLVRPGSYGGFAIAAKGLAILADPGAVVTDAVTVQGTQPQQRTVLSGLAWTNQTVSAGGAMLLLAACAGPVLLDGLVMPPVRTCLPTFPSFCLRIVGIDAWDCDLLLRDCRLDCPVQLHRCDAMIESSRIRGEDSFAVGTAVREARSAIYADLGTPQITGLSLVAGGNGAPGSILGSPDGAAIIGNGTVIRLLDGTVASGQGAAGTRGGFAISAGEVRLTGRVSLSTSAVLAIVNTTTPPVLAPMPSVVSTNAGPGGVATAAVATEPGDFVALLLGLPGPATYLPGWRDPLWLATGVALRLAATQPVSGVLVDSIAVSPLPQLRGVQAHWQALVLGPVTGAQVSDVSASLVR